MRWAYLLVAGLTACASSTSQQELQKEPSGAASGPASSASAAKMPALGGQNITVLLAPPSQYRVPLRASEVEEIYVAAAQFLEGKGFRVIPYAEIQRIIEAARANRHPKSNASCAGTQAPFVYARQMYPLAVRGSLNLKCSPTCTSVKECCSASLRLRSAGQNPTLMNAWTTSVERGAFGSQWAKAIARLAPLEEAEGPGVALVGALAQTAKAPKKRKVRLTDVWSDHGLEGPFDPASADYGTGVDIDQEALDRCWASGLTSGGSDRFDVFLRPRGFIDECRLTDPYGRPPHPRYDCICKVLEASRIYAPYSAKRDAVQVQLLNTSTPLGVSWQTGPDFPWSPSVKAVLPELASCLPKEQPRARWDVWWKLNGHGQPVEAGADGPPSAVSLCMQKKLMQVKFPCAFDEKPRQVSAKLVVRDNRNL